MRRRLIEVAFFVCVFCLFTGYCKWWEARSPTDGRVNAMTPPDYGALVVIEAGDDTYNGVYVPISSHGGAPCYCKSVPDRFLWRDASGWHLSTEIGMPADGYISRSERPVTKTWRVDGACSPAPWVSALPEFPAEE